MSEKEFDELIKVASSDIFDEDFDLDELDPEGFEMGSAEDFESMFY